MYFRAGVAGITAFMMGFWLTAAIATVVFIVDWQGPPAKIVGRGVLAVCILIGALLGWLAARREFRRGTRLRG